MPERNKTRDISPGVRAANIQWWTIFGAVILTTGLVLIFLSYAAWQFVAAGPYANVGIRLLWISKVSFAIGFVGSLLGLVMMFISKFRLAKLALSRYDR